MPDHYDHISGALDEAEKTIARRERERAGRDDDRDKPEPVEDDGLSADELIERYLGNTPTNTDKGN